MTDFYLMSDLPVFSASGSISSADADYDGVKHHDIEKVDKTQQVITLAVASVSILSVISSLLAMWWEATLIAYIAFIIPIGLAPFVIAQRYKIQWGPTFREIHNKLRMKVNEFAYENTRLHNENSRLEMEVNSLSHTEQKLEQICRQQGQDVNEFKNLLKENKIILEEKEKLLAAQEMQAVLSAFLSSERVADDVVSQRELNRFITRLKGLEGRNSTFNEESFRLAFQKRATKTPDALLELTESYLSSKSAEQSGQQDGALV